jgi:hypothetical protein
VRCEIVVKGWPAPALERGLPGFEVTRLDDRTRFIGWVIDRAAFAGLLAELRANSAILISARTVDEGPSPADVTEVPDPPPW